MSERRRRKLVDSFQHKLIKRMVIYWVVYQFTLWNLLFCWRLWESGRGDLLQQYGQFCQEFYPMYICFLILAPAFIWDAVKFYHRIAGPILRFKKAARDVAAGRPLRRVRLRKTDELMELQDDFNEMLDTLVKRGAVTLIDEARSGNANDPEAGIVLDCPDTIPEDFSHAES